MKKKVKKLITYIYPINKNDFEIRNITYVNNLLTNNNKINHEIIPANYNGAFIFNLYQMREINYYFFMGKSKEIKFKIENSNSDFPSYMFKNEYPF